MTTLVLNVDRDDDFGRKAKVTSPIIGIKDNMDAANKLGQTDPEDSDLNAIFSAIATYNSLKDEGKKVEIATICGNIHVGIKSDELLAKQLEQVIKKTDATDVIVLSDGAEDEYILPIVQSRIKITSVKRVSIKQSKELEDAYYRLIKLLGDEKILKQFFLPIALVLIVWAIFVGLGETQAGFAAMLLLLGIYLLIRVYHLEKNIFAAWTEIKSGFLTGKLSVYTYTIGIIILIAFIFVSYDQIGKIDYPEEIILIPISLFVANVVWGIVIAGLLATLGRAVDVYVRDKKAPWAYYAIPFSLGAFGFIGYALSDGFYNYIKGWPEVDYNAFWNIDFIGFLVVGILIGLIGAVIYHYAKDIHSIEDKELEIEEQTIKLIEKN